MKRILGLDVGVSSIGWAYIEIHKEDSSKNRIVKSGVRIIPMGNEKDDFTKGKSITINAERTQKRGARRNLDRWQMRRENLTKLLIEQGMMPNEDLMDCSKMRLWELRAKSVSEKLERNEIGRVLLHLNQRRGYKSNRKTAVRESESSDYLQDIATRSEHLQNENMTIGQYCYSMLCENPHFRIRGKTYYRGDYEDEFDKIWENQAKYCPDLLTQSLYERVKEEIIYYQRPLKSQKGLVSKCSFESWNRVAPKSSPYFQKFRIWQNLNNLVVTDDEGGKYNLTLDEKTILARELDDRPHLTKRQIIKLLDLAPVSKYDLNFDKVEGNRTKAGLLKVFKEVEYDTVDLLDIDPNNDPDNDEAYKFWHLLYSENDPEKLSKTLEEKYGFSKEQSYGVMNYGLEQGYPNISTKAIRKILPYLLDGNGYTDAMEMAGYRHSHHLTKEENEERTLADRIPPVKRNELRNPVVEKILNHLFNLINRILEAPNLGRPDEIRIELARELKSNAKSRQRTTENIRKNQRYNEEVRKKLITEFGIPNPTRSTIEKYKLWEETRYVSLYTGKTIPPSKLFTAEYDIEHIIPKSRLFDDSFMNKTICESSLNREKSSQTAFDFMKSRGEQAFAEYIQRVKELKLPNIKRERLLTAEADIPDDFIDRQLRETQYIAREAKKRLLGVCRNVNSTTGSVTAHLREMWGLNTLMQEVSLPIYRDKGMTETITDSKGQIKEIITNWSKRDDNRHHAIDALVVASTSPGIINDFNRLNQYFTSEEEFIRRGWEVDPPWKNFRNDVRKSIEEILISFKPGKRIYTRNKNKIATRHGELIQSVLTPRGPLHKETIYGKRKWYKEERVSLMKILKDNLVDDIVDEDIRNELNDRLEKMDHDVKGTVSDVKRNPIFRRGEAIESATVFEAYFSERKQITPQFKYEHDIVDTAAKDAVLLHLHNHGNDRKKAYANLADNPIWLNEDKGIQIKSVTIRNRGKDLESIHSTKSGEPKDYVYTRNNHHIAIYQDDKGKYHEEVVTFWKAFERRKAGGAVIVKDHPLGYHFITSLSQNEMFIYDYEGIDLNDLVEISKHLYRVQKIASKDYFFRHHLATTIQYKRDLIRVSSLPALGNFIKCRIDYLGNISIDD